MYKREFDIIKNDFLDSDGIYLLVYLDDVLKYNILYDKPEGLVYIRRRKIIFLLLLTLFV